MTTRGLDEHIQLYHLAGEHATGVIARIPADAWDVPALGPWTVRTLVGHISRSFITVIEYLGRPATQRDVRTTGDYYLAAATFTDTNAIQARAEQAGLALGDDPLAEVHRLRERANEALTTAGDPLITTIVGGMNLSDYLPTRIFELAVHTVDLARAIGEPETLPADVCALALHVAIEAATCRGDGQAVLLALTGRAALRAGYSVV